jgi:hypothetical protein
VWSAAELPEAARPILASAEGAHKGRPFAARVLAGDVVRYVGECVAVVVAAGLLVHHCYTIPTTAGAAPGARPFRAVGAVRR